MKWYRSVSRIELFLKFDHLRQIKIKAGHPAVVHAMKARIHATADIHEDAIGVFFKNSLAYSSYFFARKVICTTSSFLILPFARLRSNLLDEFCQDRVELTGYLNRFFVQQDWIPGFGFRLHGNKTSVIRFEPHREVLLN